MKRIAILLVLAVLAACAPSPAQLQSYAAATVAAWPTQTPYPTYTPLPTYTAQPTNPPVVVTATSSPTPLVTATASATPGPTADPTRASRGDGMYLVGSEIAPGVWRSDGKGKECYWKVSTKTGDIVDNFFGMAGGTMYVPATGFQVQLEGCGEWSYLGE